MGKKLRLLIGQAKSNRIVSKILYRSSTKETHDMLTDKNFLSKLINVSCNRTMVLGLLSRKLNRKEIVSFSRLNSRSSACTFCFLITLHFIFRILSRVRIAPKLPRSFLLKTSCPCVLDQLSSNVIRIPTPASLILHFFKRAYNCNFVQL